MSSRAVASVIVAWSLACAASAPAKQPEPLPEAEPVRTSDSSPPVVVEPATPEATASATASITGIPVCDEYLALYASCEAFLEPEIMAGNRRFHHAEQASLVHLAGTPEGA